MNLIIALHCSGKNVYPPLANALTKCYEHRLRSCLAARSCHSKYEFDKERACIARCSIQNGFSIFTNMKKNNNIMAKFAEIGKIGIAGIFAGAFCLIFAIVYTIKKGNK